MRIARIEIQSYRVPFRRPFTTSHGTEHERCGMLVRLTTEDGITGLGDAAALADFGTGSSQQTVQHVRALADQLTGQSLSDVPEILELVADDPTTAPARFALDSAALDAEARDAGVTLAHHLHPGSVDRVPVNAALGHEDPDLAAESAREAVLAEYKAVKLKVGVSPDIDAEIERVRAVREAIGPDTELRLDANGAWNLDDALAMTAKLSGLNISYIEQPLPASDLAGMAQLRSATDIPIAADEAATTLESVRRVIETGAADVLIIKPGVIGGIRPAREIIELARQAGMRVVITTALETGVGIAAALHLAATLPSPVPACGLATGQLLKTDLLVEPLEIREGSMPLPIDHGLGVEPSLTNWVDT